MILGDELVPMGKLSGAFLSPRTPEHLVFAYYQSALVVEFLVQRFGIPGAAGDPARPGARAWRSTRRWPPAPPPLPDLEKGFAAFAKRRAEALAPKADFAQPDLAAMQGDVAAVAARWRKRHPASVWALTEEARHLIAGGDQPRPGRCWSGRSPSTPSSADRTTPTCCWPWCTASWGTTAEERKALERLATLASDALPAYSRLLELAEAAKDERAAGAKRRAPAGVSIRWRRPAGAAFGRALETKRPKSRRWRNGP